MKSLWLSLSLSLPFVLLVPRRPSVPIRRSVLLQPSSPGKERSTVSTLTIREMGSIQLPLLREWMDPMPRCLCLQAPPPHHQQPTGHTTKTPGSLFFNRRRTRRVDPTIPESRPPSISRVPQHRDFPPHELSSPSSVALQTLCRNPPRFAHAPGFRYSTPSIIFAPPPRRCARVT